MKNIKLADVFYKAANEHLLEKNYGQYSIKSNFSCCAIAEAVKDMRVENLIKIDYNFKSLSESWVVYNLTHWSKKAKQIRPVTYAALKFAKEAGCPIGSSSAMKGVGLAERQQVRYQWLMALAMLAEEENAVVVC